MATKNRRYKRQRPYDIPLLENMVAGRQFASFRITARSQNLQNFNSLVVLHTCPPPPFLSRR